MDMTNETWTNAHDLALVYIALAYGTDYRLSESELGTITRYVSGWRDGAGESEVQEVVMEAMSVFLERPAEQEVVRSMKALRGTLSQDERRRALEEVVRIAEADGVLLSHEQSLISIIADEWDIRQTAESLLAATSATVEERPAWTLLHDLALIGVVVAHSTDNDLAEREIDVILERLGQWQPDLNEEEVRRVLREALAFYATEPGEEELRRSVRALRDALPMMQRLAVLDDLYQIAEADGSLIEAEQAMITSLARALEVNVRFNGQPDAQA